MAYGEEMLPVAKRDHLEQCEACQQRLASYRRLNSRLFSKLYRSACPGAVELNYYCLGGLSQEDRVSIASHVLDCPTCADDVAEIRRQQLSVSGIGEISGEYRPGYVSRAGSDEDEDDSGRSGHDAVPRSDDREASVIDTDRAREPFDLLSRLVRHHAHPGRRKHREIARPPR